MRRSRWEDAGGGGDETLDQPVTVTERQLRSLKAGSRLGLFGLILALLATGMAAWAMFRPSQETVPTEPVAATTPAPTPAPTAADTVTAAPTAGAPIAASAAPQATSGTGGPAAVIPERKASTKRASTTVNASTRGSRTSRAPAPKMEAFDPAPSTAKAAVPSPGATPVPIEPARPAAADTSSR